MIVILRIVIRIRATDRFLGIRQQRRGVDNPPVNRFRIKKWLQRGTGTAERCGDVDIPMFWQRGRNHRADTTGGVVHNHNAAGRGTERLQGFPGGFHNPAGHLLEIKVQRAPAVGVAGPQPRNCLAGKMRGIGWQLEVARLRRRGQKRLSSHSRRQEMLLLHSQHIALIALHHLIRVPPRI